MSGTHAGRRSGSIETVVPRRATTTPASRGAARADISKGGQRVVRLPETVVTKFLIESGRSLKCQ
jgi:hypothetical protein